MRRKLLLLALALVLALCSQATPKNVLPVSASGGTLTLVSDPSTEYLDGSEWHPAVAAWVHGGWPNIDGATWIWRSYQVTPEEAQNGVGPVIFRKTFSLPAAASGASGSLQITADNAYRVYLNGSLLGGDGSMNLATDEQYPYSWQSIETFTVRPHPGDNTLMFEVVGHHFPPATLPTHNPAAFVWKADVTWSPAQNIVLFVQGIDSESNCDDEDTNNGYGKTKWLRNYLKSKLGLSDESFLYYDYTSNSASPTPCASSPLPEYKDEDACWSLNDSWTLSCPTWPLFCHTLPIPNGGQARRLAQYLHTYFTDPLHANDRITLIGHSQGGVLAAYVASGGVDSPDVLSSEELGKIEAVITLDSPLKGVNADGANIYDTVWDCSRFNSFADSAGDMSHGSEIVTDLAHPRYIPPLFTVDGFEGKVEGTAGLVTIADPDTSSLWWQRSSLRVAAPDHGDVWTGNVGFENELEDYIYCAIRGLQPSAECEKWARPGVCFVPRLDSTTIPIPVPHPAPVMRTRTTGLGSESLSALRNALQVAGAEELPVTTTLIAPSGRRIDANTVADDVAHFVDSSGEVFEITSPGIGMWRAELYGSAVPPEGQEIGFAAMVPPDAADDLDGDGIWDDSDNCPSAFNASQLDTDGDTVGDACDSDIDDDSVANASDNCPTVANADQADSDQNGLGDACDPDGVTDSDGDGLVNNSDNCPFDYNPDQANADSDRWGDVCDLVTNAPVGGIAEYPQLEAPRTTNTGSRKDLVLATLTTVGGITLLLAVGGWVAVRRRAR